MARTLDADPEPLLRGSGVDANTPPRGDAHIAVERYFEVWRRAMALFDHGFPLRVASAFRHEDNEIFGFLAMSCANIGEAFDRTLHYSRLYTVGATYEMDVDRDATRISWLPWPGALDDVGYRAAMDYHMANMEQAIRQLGHSPPRPVEVRLRHAAPPGATEYLSFYGTTPRFGCPRYELVYPVGLREVGVTTFNSRLRDYFDLECRKMIEKLGAANTVTAQVRKTLIGVMDGGDSGIEAIAKRLGMSTRSLQRRLAEEQTSYNDLLAEVREEFAKRYLARGTLTASEVAYLIGFTEPPAFFKAFKRWTGLTPREFQERG
ncbi:AraC family transcriptional regulator [Hyalangium versicolor]|uniref:AraC family transcriptional regulator n=1 Tax=Hyalangium versicolor TaxID=2861190 RepID=UPI001CCDB3A2|nr:AraC family transcriptional regulator [Hyalangium versicolor]